MPKTHKTHRVTLPDSIHAAALRGKVSMLMVRMKPQPPTWAQYPSTAPLREDTFIHWTDGASTDFRCWPADEPMRVPYASGDLIACREPWLYFASYIYKHEMAADSASLYKWKPASRMPLAACRLWFRVQSVEACRVADVTEEEARAMGYPRIITRDGSLHRAGMKLACERAGWDRQDWAWKLKVERDGEMIPEAAIYRGGPSAARIRELQEKYRCTPDGWFFERQADGTWKRGETRGFVFGVEAWKKRAQDRCFYCNQVVGQEHARNCVIITKRVRVRYSFEIEIDVPHHWSKEDVEFRRGMSSWCADNAIGELQRLTDQGGCLCSVFKCEFLEVSDNTPARKTKKRRKTEKSESGGEET